ncbi:amidohydrolase [Clostridiaceae bacterium M8S5]|nr:amidohydrolase [Clostridiaceae bacterium M8S5]
MIAIKGGKVMTITNGVIEEGTIIIKDEKIVSVGKDIDIPVEAEIIDASGKWIMPGLIDAHTHISVMGEPNTMPGLQGDGNEVGDPITPFVSAVDALNPDDEGIKIVREAGFTSVYTGPGSANVIGGTGLSLKLRGETVEEMAYKGSAHMKMALGENPKRVYGVNNKTPKTRMGIAALLRKTLLEAKEYAKNKELAKKDPDKMPKYDIKFESLLKVISGEQKVRIHCHRSDDILTGIRIAEEFNLDYSLEHATEGYKKAKILGEKNVNCVVGPFLMPPAKMEVWDQKLENACILSKAGVKVCLTADGASGTAWLPIHVGLLIARGLPEEEAFKGVTIYPAELLGISDRVGSIEIGKDADIAIFDGHPFSNFTLCCLTMIEGKVYHTDGQLI